MDTLERKDTGFVGYSFLHMVDHAENQRAQPPQRLCPECGRCMMPYYKRKEKRLVVYYWTCENHDCPVVKVYVRQGGRLEVKKAHAL